jgi:hypothetical protein
MTLCNRCQDRTEYEWYEDHLGKWKLGIKLDVNNYRQHKCIQENPRETEKNIRFPDRKGWIEFTCICGSKVKLSKKHFSPKEILRCNECRGV